MSMPTGRTEHQLKKSPESSGHGQFAKIRDRQPGASEAGASGGWAAQTKERLAHAVNALVRSYGDSQLPGPSDPGAPGARALAMSR